MNHGNALDWIAIGSILIWHVLFPSWRFDESFVSVDKEKAISLITAPPIMQGVTATIDYEATGIRAFMAFVKFSILWFLFFLGQEEAKKGTNRLVPRATNFLLGIAFVTVMAVFGSETLLEDADPLWGGGHLSESPIDNTATTDERMIMSVRIFLFLLVPVGAGFLAGICWKPKPVPIVLSPSDESDDG